MAPELLERLVDEHSDSLHRDRLLPNARVVAARTLSALSRRRRFAILLLLLLPAAYVIERARCTRQPVFMVHFCAHGTAVGMVDSRLDGRRGVENGGSLAIHGANVNAHH